MHIKGWIWKFFFLSHVVSILRHHTYSVITLHVNAALDSSALLFEAKSIKLYCYSVSVTSNMRCISVNLFVFIFHSTSGIAIICSSTRNELSPRLLTVRGLNGIQVRLGVIQKDYERKTRAALAWIPEKYHKHAQKIHQRELRQDNRSASFIIYLTFQLINFAALRQSPREACESEMERKARKNVIQSFHVARKVNTMITLFIREGDVGGEAPFSCVAIVFTF